MFVCVCVCVCLYVDRACVRAYVKWKLWQREFTSYGNLDIAIEMTDNSMNFDICVLLDLTFCQKCESFCKRGNLLQHTEIDR